MSNWKVLPALVLAYIAVGSAPASAPPDRDHDQIPDRWEERYGLSTSRNSADGDPDRDGLRNRREYRERTNPRKRDTDRDGYNDRSEVAAGTNPSKAGSRPFPNQANTGVPGGWKPRATRDTDLFVTEPGAVVEDLLLTDSAALIVDAPNVTIRRVKIEGGWINNFYGSECANGLRIVNTTIEPAPGQDWGQDSEGVVSYGGYTARGVEIWHRSEGFRVGGSNEGCGPVTIENSFADIVPPRPCGDWHGDGIQGYDGPEVEVRNVTLILEDAGGSCYGTAPFFYPDAQGNARADVDHLLVHGGGYPFRLTTAGSVSRLKVVDDSWVFEPADVECSLLSHWDADVVSISSDYQVRRTVRSLPCD